MRCYKLPQFKLRDGYLRKRITPGRVRARARTPRFALNHISTQPPPRQMDRYTEAGSFFMLYDKVIFSLASP